MVYFWGGVVKKVYILEDFVQKSFFYKSFKKFINLIRMYCTSKKMDATSFLHELQISPESDHIEVMFFKPKLI